MRLNDLIKGEALTVHGAATAGQIDLRGITSDSRLVEPGFLFAALPGFRSDGRAYIADALRRGAVAVLAPAGTTLPAEGAAVPLIADANPRRRLALLAARFYGHQPQHVAAVTGTSGKTSVADFTRQIWTRLDLPAASLGTLGLVSPDRTEYLSLTTLDPVGLHQRLAALAAEGVDHLAIEASSHGLDQYRLDGVRIAAAAFTNLSRDHLDYHDSMASYLAAKRRLFAELLEPGGAAVLNADAPEFAALERLCRDHGHRILSYGRAGRHLMLEEAKAMADGQRLTIRVEGWPSQIHFPIAGAFQAENALCALGLAIATGAPAEAAVAALPALRGVHGRVELVARHPNGAAIYVDYAHKPGALEAVLRALRPHTAGRLVVVFGCGGDRDHGKRPIMGAIAERLADRVVVTDDNPRSEDPAAIREAILAACKDAVEIGDRGEAIRRTVALLEPGDLLVIAGKGHETGQIVGAVTQPFDDSEVARAAVAGLSGAMGA